MNRNWDIMRNSANGADPSGTTRRMEQNRMRGRERWTSRDRDEGFGENYSTQRYNPNYGQHVPSYGDEGFGRASQGFGAYGGGYGYEHGESEALGDGGGYGYDTRGRDHGRDRFRAEFGLLGRMENGIDRAFGNDWEYGNRGEGMRGEMRGEGMRGETRGDDHPSLWQRVKGAFTGKGPKNWTRSDERIREDVCECLTYHPHVDATEIDVVVKDGEVTLTGTVDDRQTKRLAEDIVEGVRGVRDVHNQIRVVRTGQMSGTTNQTSGLTGTSGTTTGTTTGTNQTWNQARR